MGHFWPFLVIFAQGKLFCKKFGSLTHNPTWAPNTMRSLKKTQWDNSKKISKSQTSPDSLCPSGQGREFLIFISMFESILKLPHAYKKENLYWRYSFIMTSNFITQLFQEFHVLFAAVSNQSLSEIANIARSGTKCHHIITSKSITHCFPRTPCLIRTQQQIIYLYVTSSCKETIKKRLF